VLVFSIFVVLTQSQADSGGCLHELASDNVKNTEGYCTALLPPLAPAETHELVARMVRVLEGDGTVFPFKARLGWGISNEEQMQIDGVAAAHAGEDDRKLPNCVPNTYGSHDLEYLAGLFVPGARGELADADTLVELGAGIGRVMAVAALVSNSSIRGIELSPTRFEIGCRVLGLLEQSFKNRTEALTAINVVSGEACPVSRRVELWRGDLLRAPAGLLRADSIRRGEAVSWPGALTFFSYADCLPDMLLDQIMRLASSASHGCVRLLVSRSTSRRANQVREGLRRVMVPFHRYLLHTRDGDECRKPIKAEDAAGGATDAAVSLGWGTWDPRTAKKPEL